MSVAEWGPWELRRLVPRTFWRVSGIGDYTFQVVAPAERRLVSLCTSQGEAVAIPISLQSKVLLNGKYVDVLVNESQHPLLFDAVTHMRTVLHARGSMIGKYLKLFQAYEAVAPEPLIELAAIRHQLSHSRVSPPKTVAALDRLFGTRAIDLYDSRHRRVFYRQMARMMMLTDTYLAHLIWTIDPAPLFLRLPPE